MRASLLLATPVAVENGLLWSVQDDDRQRPLALVVLDETSGRTESSTTPVCTLKGHEAIDVRGTLGVAQRRPFVPGPNSRDGSRPRPPSCATRILCSTRAWALRSAALGQISTEPAAVPGLGHSCPAILRQSARTPSRGP